MYKYKNFEYTLEEVEDAANKENLSVDNYIKEYNIEKTDPDPEENNITPDPVDEGKQSPSQEITSATVEEDIALEPTVTDSKSEDISSALPKIEETVIETGTAAETDIIDPKDEVYKPNPQKYMSDFVEAIQSEAATGYKRGETITSSMELFNAGEGANAEEIEAWLQDNLPTAEKTLQSSLMKEWQKTYDKLGGGILGWTIATAFEPRVLPAIAAQSTALQIASLKDETVRRNAALGAAGGATLGLATTGGVTSIPNAIIGAFSSGMATVETALTYSELLREAIQSEGIEFTKNNIPNIIKATKAILENPEKLSSLQRKAAGRGIAIGVVEGVTGSLAKGVGSTLFKRGANPLSISTAMAGTGAVGGSLGEIAGMTAAGQDLETSEILFEGFTPGPSSLFATQNLVKNVKTLVYEGEVNNIIEPTEYTNISYAFDPLEKTTDTQVKLSEIPGSVDILDRKVRQEVYKKNITKAQGDAIRENFRETQGATNQVKPLNFNTKQKTKAVELLKEKNQLNIQIEQVGDKALTAPQQERIDAINKELKGLNVERAAETIAAATDASRVIVVENDKELKDKYNIEGANYSVAGGFFQDGKIYINKEIAGTLDTVTEGAHELLHPIAKEAIKNNPKIIEEFKNLLPKDIKELVDARIKENDDIYTDEYLAANPDEFLTQFSDLVLEGQIKFNENIFTKIGDFIIPILRKLGFKKIKFNSGQDVYKFMREYTRNIKEGKISEGIKEVIPTELKTEDTTFSLKGKEASERVQKLYEQKGPDGAAFEIIQEFKPITTAIARKRKNAPGYDEALLIDEIETGKGGILDIIRNFDPTKNDSVAAQINLLLPKRAIAASKRILGEEFTADIADVQIAETQAAEPEVIETTVQEELPKIKVAERIFTPEEQTKLKEKVSQELPNIIEEQLTFKTLPNLTAEVIAEKLNMPVKKLTGAANFTQAEFGRAQQFIKDNIKTVKLALPQAAVLEGEAVSEELIGTATNVPNKLLKNPKLYTRLERTTKKAGLVPYEKNKNIQDVDILEAVGIVEDKLTKGPRDPEAQTAKGILNVLGRTAANQEVREQGAQAEKISKSKETDLRAGVGDRILFSKKILPKERDKRNKILINESAKAFEGNPSFDEYLKRIRPVLQNNKVTKALSDLGNKSFRGNIYEYYVWERLNSLNINGLELMPPEYGTGTDIKATFFGQPFDLEVKLNLQDAFGAPTIYFNSEKNKWSFDESNLDKEIFDIVEKNIDQQKVNNFLTQIQKLGAYSLNESGNKKEKVDFTLRIPAESYKENKNKSKTGKIDKLTASVYKKIAGKQLNKKEKQSLNNAIIEYYDKKGINYIVINNQMYYLKENPLQLPINQLTGDVYIKFRIKPGGKKSNKKLGDFYNLMTAVQFGMDKATSKGTSLTKAFQIKLSKSISKAANKNNSKLPKSKQAKKGSTNQLVLDNMKLIDEEINQRRKEFFDSEKLSQDFNKIIENKTGIAKEKKYSDARAQTVGANKGRFKFFIPPSAEDFVGLLYNTLGKGKLGEQQMAWYKENLLDPYARAMSEISSARVALFEDYKTLKNDLKIIPKNLRKKIPEGDFTVEQAVRAYVWNKQDMEVPGLDNADMRELISYVANNNELVIFADNLIDINKGKGYPKPDVGWEAGTITTDLINGINTTRRAEALQQWQENVDIIFSKENLNKLQAAYGTGYRKALENILTRMKTGRNRGYNKDALVGRFTDWINNSVGAIMFFNMRSALLQTISSINFINYSDNNIFKAAKAFGNQKQYWADFKFLFNSDFLKERRGGLRFNVSESDISDMAKEGGARGVISKILQAGFLPTQTADSFAIASGGATFYRNRLNKYKKEGLSEKEAQEKAFLDFREVAEEAQQSSRPDRISAQQAGSLGRFILAFANTPAQYARLTKKALSDAVNNRGSRKENISKAIYYVVIQNLVFTALQNALFAFAFDDEEEEDKKKEKKYLRMANGMADGFLRGLGIAGAGIATGKNVILKLINETDKAEYKRDYGKVLALEPLGISPPVQSKVTKLVRAGDQYKYTVKRWENAKEPKDYLNIELYLPPANVISALTNIPLDRVVKKTDNLVNMTQADLAAWERAALLFGWSDWELGIDKKTKKPIEEGEFDASGGFDTSGGFEPSGGF